MTLSAQGTLLLESTPQSGGRQELCRLSMDAISTNPYQPRKVFSEPQLQELASSIRQYGLLSPVVVRRMGVGTYELIAGERRLRACKMLRMTHIDALVMPAFDQDAALLALIENLQRENLSFLEEAEAYCSVMGDHHMSQGELARRLGKSASGVANKLRLLKLPDEVKTIIADQGLSERHARALLRLPDRYSQLHATRRIVEMHMTVKEAEAYIEQMLTEGLLVPLEDGEMLQKPKRKIRSIYRDHRIFVNAVLDTVKQLKLAGVGVDSKVTEREDCVEVLITLPRIRSSQAE